MALKLRGFRFEYSGHDDLVDTDYPAMRGFRFDLKDVDFNEDPQIRGFRFEMSDTAGATAFTIHDNAPNLDTRDRQQNIEFTHLPGIFRAPPEPDRRMRHGKYSFNNRVRIGKRRKV